MSDCKIKTKNSDGSITEIEVSAEIEEMDREFNSKERYQKYKKRKHATNRKYEVSLEEILEANQTACNHWTSYKKRKKEDS